MNFLDVDFLRDNGIYIGNPPFGKRGKKAFDFILKCIELDASIIAFILPPNINTKLRLDSIKEKNYSLVYSEQLLDDSFYFNNEKKSDMVAESIFQIYMKNDYIKKYDINTIDTINLKNNSHVHVYTINDNIIKNPKRDVGGVPFIQDGVGKQ
jgi:hypothetical protein